MKSKKYTMKSKKHSESTNVHKSIFSKFNIFPILISRTILRYKNYTVNI